MPDSGQWSPGGGDPSLNEIRRVDRFFDALAADQHAYSTDSTEAELAKAAQWCTEQGTMAAKGDRFEPEGWTPKFKVIEVWNKAFPAA